MEEVFEETMDLQKKADVVSRIETQELPMYRRISQVQFHVWDILFDIRQILAILMCFLHIGLVTNMK
jgi:hypothetical protein